MKIQNPGFQSAASNILETTLTPPVKGKRQKKEEGEEVIENIEDIVLDTVLKIAKA